MLFEKLTQDNPILSQKIKVESGGVKYKNSMISEESASMLMKEGVSESRVNQFSPRFHRDYPKMFEKNDLILVMEKSHLNYIPSKYRWKAFLFLDFVHGVSIGNVPDPYFDPPYERAYNMIKEALEMLFEQIIQLHGS